MSEIILMTKKSLILTIMSGMTIYTVLKIQLLQLIS